MANVQKHKNVRISHNNNVTPSYYHVIDKEGTLREYNTKDWEMEVTFTRKVKPFPAGSLVLSNAGDRDELFQKINGRWYYLYLTDEFDEWTDYGDQLSDAKIRENKDNLWKVLYEPDSE